MGSDVIALPVGSNTTTGTYNLLHNTYWSSTEYNETVAWLWRFSPSYRNAFSYYKSNSYYVRCVRRF
jgi:uncharacterized protein (TIGR02145 family)